MLIQIEMAFPSFKNKAYFLQHTFLYSLPFKSPAKRYHYAN